jgi:hypothetical protein
MANQGGPMTKLEDVLRQARQLSPEEKSQLISHLLESDGDSYNKTESRRRWREIAGIAPNLMQGQDAQAWISQNRREADAKRQQ